MKTESNDKKGSRYELNKTEKFGMRIEIDTMISYKTY